MNVWIYLGIVTHLVWLFCVEIAFSSSSKAPLFFNFFTRLLTAFSDHFPSIDDSSLPFFHASKRFTTGGVNGNIFYRIYFVLFRQIRDAPLSSVISNNFSPFAQFNFASCHSTATWNTNTQRNDAPNIFISSHWYIYLFICCFCFLLSMYRVHSSSF